MSRALLLAGVAVLVPSDANAHAFAQRYDLPLPLWHYLIGAGATVVLSFVVAALFLGRGETRIADAAPCLAGAAPRGLPNAL